MLYPFRMALVLNQLWSRTRAMLVSRLSIQPYRDNLLITLGAKPQIDSISQWVSVWNRRGREVQKPGKTDGHFT